MSQKRHLLYPLLVLAIGLALTVFLATGKPGPERKPMRTAVALPVEVMNVAAGEHRLTVHTQGSVQAKQEIDLVAEVAGKIESVAPQFVAGGFVTAGDTLVQVSKADYEIAKIQARARVAEAQELLATSKGQALQAKREWRDLGSKTANELFLKKPQLARAEAQLAAAKAEARKAGLDLQRTGVAAPFDGRVRETFVNAGQYLTPGAPVARIYATDVAEVRLPLSDRQVALLDLPLDGSVAAAPVPVTLDGEFGGKRWQWRGEIVRTEASIDVQSRVLFAVAQIPDPYGKHAAPAVAGDGAQKRPPLTIGQFVEAKISGKQLRDVTVLPRDAVRANNVVWLGDAEGLLDIVPVEILQMTPTHTAVRGLPAGNLQVVTSSIPFAVQGMSLLPTVIAGEQDKAAPDTSAKAGATVAEDADTGAALSQRAQLAQ